MPAIWRAVIIVPTTKSFLTSNILVPMNQNQILAKDMMLLKFTTKKNLIRSMNMLAQKIIEKYSSALA